MKVKQFIKKNFKVRIEIILCVLISFFIGVGLRADGFSLWPLYLLRENIINTLNSEDVLFKSFLATSNREFLGTWDKIRHDYLYENLDKKALIASATEGLVLGLKDPYSYIENINSNFKTGIIAVLLDYNEEGQVKIKEIIKDGPADKAGLKKGDVFISVDAVDITNHSIKNLKKLLSGNAGEQIDISIYRPSTNKELSKKLTRIEGASKAVFINNLGGGIYKLKIDSFSDDLYEKFNEEIKKIDEEKLKGIIIDLRGNLGGSVSEARKLISDFIEDDLLILKQIYRDGFELEHRSYKSKYPYLINVPKVILIDSSTASCSEIMTLVLRDYQNIKIFGEKSFGKGVITTETQIAENKILHLTIAKWFGPNGESIDKIGIKPDIMTDDPLEDSLVYLKNMN